MSDVQEKEQPKTKIISLKVGGDWEYNVVFNQTFQCQKVQTNDRPLDSLTTAIEHVVTKALDYYKLYEVLATFHSITFADSDDGLGTFTLDLSVKPRGNVYIWLKVGCSKISRKEILKEGTADDVPEFFERNRLNDAVDALEQEIKKYALGERLQKELPIEEIQNPDVKKELSQGDLFSKAIEKASKVFGKKMKDAGATVIVNAGSKVIDVDFSHSQVAEK